jgi:superfamily II DNA or RNA helicase
VTEPDRGLGARVASGEAGTVQRRGDHLIVEAPEAMPDRLWRRVELRLVTDTGASSIGRGRSVVVPVDAAADARHDHTEWGPAALWTWQGDAAGAAAAAAVTDVRHQLQAALNTDVDEQAIAELQAKGGQAGLRRSLLPEQAVAVTRLVSTRSGANFSVPGSGKTTMTYAVFAHLRLAGLVDRMLVVAPLSAHDAWATEAVECFTPAALPTVSVQPTRWSRRDDVIVVNYERAANPSTPAVSQRWAQGHKVLVVFDEAHRAKRGRAGLHGDAAAELAGLATCRLALTGTPMPNGEQDLATILDLVWPGSGERLVFGDLKSRMNRTWVRVTKDQLGIQPMVLATETLRLDPAHRTLYELVTGEIEALARSGLLDDRPDLARRAVLRTLAVATNPALVLQGDRALSWDPDVRGVLDEIRTEADLRSLVAQCRPAKLARVADIARDHAGDGRKLLVWTNFLGTVDELRRLLADHRPAVITGATPSEAPEAPADRARELARFRADVDCEVLIATPQTLGEGVSLHRTCQSQVHVDRTFNAGLYLQALDRTHRVGMPPGVRARAVTLVSENTIDERVERVLGEKLERMRKALADPGLQLLSLPDDDPDSLDEPPRSVADYVNNAGQPD